MTGNVKTKKKTGRPQKNIETKLTGVVSTTLTAEEKNRLDAFCQNLNLNRSDFVRGLIKANI